MYRHKLIIEKENKIKYHVIILATMTLEKEEEKTSYISFKIFDLQT